ncbi:MAG: hypothetical protein OEY28_12040 [Nitrospira sp.]|nr:hypothetical protein [Nitrospira sp.]
MGHRQVEPDGVPDPDEEELPEDDGAGVEAVAAAVVPVPSLFVSLFAPADDSVVFPVGGFILSE